MPHRTHRFATAVVAGSATGIAAGLLGVVTGGHLWALIFIGPFASGALIIWTDLAYGPEGNGTAIMRGTGAGLFSGFFCLMALPAYLALWQEVSLVTVYNPVYWLTHQAEVSEELGSRAGWCAILGAMFGASCMTAGGVGGFLTNFALRTE
jgi:hypothetical protein